jgi:glucosylceramidase
VSAGLDDVAFRNPDGSLVLVAYNNAPGPTQFAVSWRQKTFTYELPAQGTVTFVWNRSH